MNQDPKDAAGPKKEAPKPYEAPKVRSYGNIQQITKAHDGKQVDSPGGHKTNL